MSQTNETVDLEITPKEAPAKHERKKRFRPYRSSVRTIMGRVGESGAIRRSHTVNVQEDLAVRALELIAKRTGTFVGSNGRSKITKTDVEAAVRLEFGDKFATGAIEFAESVLKRVREDGGEVEEEEETGAQVADAASAVVVAA